jgi:hypothetical protein
MFSQFLRYILIPFCAAPNHTLASVLNSSGSRWSGRTSLQALSPGFPLDEPSDAPLPRVAPLPTDVPVPTPTDVPIPDPGYVPPREPGNTPTPAKPRPDEIDPRPRRIP